jgi:hypothetical protein
MNLSYLIYQAERPRSAAEQRAEDARRGELAMALTRVLRGRRQVSPTAPTVPATSAVPARPALTVLSGTDAITVPAPRLAAQCETRTAC